MKKKLDFTKPLVTVSKNTPVEVFHSEAGIIVAFSSAINKSPVCEFIDIYGYPRNFSTETPLIKNVDPTPLEDLIAAAEEAKDWMEFFAEDYVGLEDAGAAMNAYEMLTNALERVKIELTEAKK